MRRLLWALAVAAGITQPGGAGTQIFIEDNAHADFGGDGLCSFADITTKFPADWVDNGNGEYEGLVSLQNGDGVGTAPTTLKETLSKLSFAAGKTYTVSSVGQNTRTTEFGTEIAGIVPSAKDGVDISFGALPALRGIINIYGSKLRSSTGILMTPNGGAAPIAGRGRLIGNLIQFSTLTGQFGNPASGNFALIANNNFVGIGAGANINSWGADVDRDNNFSGTGNSRLINSAASQLNMERPKFSGAPSIAAIADTHSSGIDWNIAEPEWPQTCSQFSAVVQTSEWWGFDVVTFNPNTLARVAGVPIEVYDLFGTLVCDTVTDSEGRIMFNAGVSLNRLRLRRHTGGGTPVITEYGPLFVHVNHEAGADTRYLPQHFRLVWPGRDYGFGRQLQNVLLPIPLVAVGDFGAGGREEWRPGYA